MGPPLTSPVVAAGSPNEVRERDLERAGESKQSLSAGVAATGLDLLEGPAADPGSEVETLLGEVLANALGSDVVADDAEPVLDPVVVIRWSVHLVHAQACRDR